VSIAVLTPRVAVAHPTRVLSFLRALVLCVLSLALLSGSLRECTGWEATPEARMACCSKDGTCPMRKKNAPDPQRQHVLTQADADSCCASSEQPPSQQGGEAVALTITAAVLGAPTVLPAPTPALVSSDRWRTIAPVPGTPVAKHLLLSVFLV
jgi:hypothetical protein